MIMDLSASPQSVVKLMGLAPLGSIRSPFPFQARKQTLRLEAEEAGGGESCGHKVRELRELRVKPALSSTTANRTA
jgi:hypothetical protein